LKPPKVLVQLRRNKLDNFGSLFLKPLIESSSEVFKK
jgi:hypothetical protein